MSYFMSIALKHSFLAASRTTHRYCHLLMGSFCSVEALHEQEISLPKGRLCTVTRALYGAERCILGAGLLSVMHAPRVITNRRLYLLSWHRFLRTVQHKVLLNKGLQSRFHNKLSCCRRKAYYPLTPRIHLRGGSLTQ